jgi:hypothetical protein
MKQQADQFMTERQFKVGDMLLICLQPYNYLVIICKDSDK